MQAVRLAAVNQLEMVRVPVPEPDGDKRVLDVCCCALCRTDVKMWQQGHRDLRLPRILGHEVCAADPQTRHRYVIWPGSSCGKCRWCRSGHENLCPQMSIMGFHRDGGLAEKVLAPDTSLIAVPPTLPSRIAALAEPLACSLNALEQLHPSPGDSLLIVGGGPVGLLLALAAVSTHLRTVLLERQPQRLERSREFRQRLGIQAVEHPRQLPDEPFTAATCATSAVDAVATALKTLAPEGRFCFFSGLPASPQVPSSAWNLVHYRQLRVKGAYGCTYRQMVQAVSLLQNHTDCVDELIDTEIGLDAVPRAFADIGATRVLKVVVAFSR